jgi:hypothetical protein
VKRIGKYGRKITLSWIVKRYEKYGRKVGWIVKWYGKYSSLFPPVFSKSFDYFLPYFSNLFTI